MIASFTNDASTTDRIHRSIGLDEAGCVDFVAFFLGRDRGDDCVLNLLLDTAVRFVGSQQALDVGFVEAEQAAIVAA